MATSTLPPKSPQEEDERYNTAAQLSQEEFSAGGSKSGGFSAEEKQRMHDRHVTDQMEGELANPTKSVRQRERNSGSDIPFENTGKRSGRGASPLSRSSNPLTAMNALRKGGPLGLIVSIILGLSAFMFGSYSLLPIHIYENFLSKFDSSTTSYTIRTDRMIVNKLVDDGTRGVCTNIVSIACKFSRPSNFMLTQLENNGVTPLDKSGKPIKKTLLGWPNTRPATYQFTDSTGSIVNTDAKNLRTALRGNPEFRAAFHNGLKTRLQIFSDSIFKSVAAKFGFTKQNTLADKKTPTDITNTIDDETTGKTSESGTTSTGTGTPEEEAQATQEIQDDIRTEADSEAGKLAKSGMGNAVGLAAGGLCLVGDGPGIITRTARAFQMAQVVRFGALFMTAISALKAGQATENEVSTYASALTRTDSNGKSALDSLGIRYSLYGDTSPNDDKTYKNLIPGGAVAAALGLAAVILDSSVKKDVCTIATSPVSGVAIDAALAPETLGLGTLANIVVGALIAVGISAIAPAAIDLVLKTIPPQVYQDLMKTAFGDITQFVYTGTGTNKALGGEGFGDALGSGVSNTLGQLSNAGGNVPLTVNDAVAYNQQTQAVNLAYAQEDRATHSPLDASNPNTMMGAFFEKLIPVYSQLGSLTSLASSVSGIASSSFGSLITGNLYAASTTDKQQYQMCTDPALTDANGNQVAAGPFCNIQYGIPAQYLDMDPQQIVQDLIDEKQIDPQSGEAIQGAAPITTTIANAVGVPTDTGITDYYDWLQTCTDGKSDQAFNCEITDKQSAEYALYTIDHRVQKNLDNEDTAPVPGTTSTNTNLSTNKQELAKAILDSGKVDFLGDYDSGYSISPAQQRKIFSDIADGKTDGNSTPCGMNIKVLQAIKEVVDHHKSVVISDTNSLCVGYTARNNPTSRHYGGNGSAVDFAVIDGEPLDSSASGVAAAEALLRELQPMMDTGSDYAHQTQVGQDECHKIDIGNVDWFWDTCNHQHIAWPTADDPNLKVLYGTT